MAGPHTGHPAKVKYYKISQVGGFFRLNLFVNQKGITGLCDQKAVIKLSGAGIGYHHSYLNLDTTGRTLVAVRTEAGKASDLICTQT